MDEKQSNDNGGGPSVRQLQRASQVMDHLIEIVSEMDQTDIVQTTLSRVGNNNIDESSSLFNDSSEMIDIYDVEVSPDLRHARVYYSLSSVDHLPFATQQKAMVLWDKYLVKGRGRGLIQHRLSMRMRNKYPPKLHFIPAPQVHDLVQQELDKLDEILVLDNSSHNNNNG